MTTLSVRKAVPLVLLSAAPVLKLGDVQPLEILQILLVCAAVPVFFYRRLKVPVSGLWRGYGAGYGIFLGLCALVSLLSLRLSFYPPPETSVLKQPLVLSAARLAELSLAAYFMLALASMFRRDRRSLRVALDAYVAAGVLTACISIVSYALVAGFGFWSFAVYGPDQRVRGLFNEGGPFGMFLVSVLVAAALRLRLFRPAFGFVYKAAFVPLAAALLLSGSKAGLLAVAGLAAIGMLVTGSRKQKIALVGCTVLTLAAFAVMFQGKLAGYLYSYMNFDEALTYRPDDINLIMGRITGAMIVPRMIAAHPLMGIGVGNYSLMRNDPEYLQGLPAVIEWDLPGMGLIGSAAELGVPLTLFLVALLLRPLARARWRKAPALVAVAAGFQPLALLLGVNLNLFYPWLVAAFVLALEPAETLPGAGMRAGAAG